MRSLSERRPPQAELRLITPSEGADYLGWLARAPLAHEHVGWTPTRDWIGRPVSLALVAPEGQPLGLLCVARDQLGVAWVQAFGCTSRPSTRSIWERLWGAAHTQFKSMGVEKVWAMANETWFLDLLQQSGFAPTNKVVTLVAGSTTPGQMPLSPSAIGLRPFHREDFEAVVRVDNRAFGIPWQMDPEALEATLRNAVLARVAETGAQVIGYELCTETPQGWHLARLAVDPDYQRGGVGRTLVGEVLAWKVRLGVRSLTVNTQAENRASLQLYRSFGFMPSGEILPVYCAVLL